MTALERQHALLLERADELQRTLKAVEELMNARRSGIQLTAEEQVEIFGSAAFDDDVSIEAERRWGDMRYTPISPPPNAPG